MESTSPRSPFQHHFDWTAQQLLPLGIALRVICLWFPYAWNGVCRTGGPSYLKWSAPYNKICRWSCWRCLTTAAPDKGTVSTLGNGSTLNITHAFRAQKSAIPFVVVGFASLSVRVTIEVIAMLVRNLERERMQIVSSSAVRLQHLGDSYTFSDFSYDHLVLCFIGFRVENSQCSNVKCNPSLYLIQ